MEAIFWITGYMLLQHKSGASKFTQCSNYATGWMNRVWFPAGAWIYSPSRPDQVLGPPSLLSYGYQQ
jgi:hypothetical protein